MTSTLGKVRPWKLNQKMPTDLFLCLYNIYTEKKGKDIDFVCLDPADPELSPLIYQGIGDDLRLKIWLQVL